MNPHLPPYEITSLPALIHAYTTLTPIAAHSDEPILITGPTGTGKTRLARYIHELRCTTLHRSLDAAPFKDLNCATLYGDTLVSELFGHVKGAFTGAHANRKGILELAHNGTAFLDEISELSPHAQAMLLGAVHKKIFYRLGDFSSPVRSHFRLVCASNRDLRAMVDHGTFREDLFARIAFHTIYLPSLRARFCDLPAHASLALEQWNKANRCNLPPVAFPTAAQRRFFSFATSPDALWPGNFRQLNASIRHMCIVACAHNPSRPSISLDIVKEECRRLSAEWSVPSSSSATQPLPASSPPLSLDQLAALIAPHRTRRSFFDALEHHLQDLALARTLGNKAAAARFLYETPHHPLANPSDVFSKRRARLER